MDPAQFLPRGFGLGATFASLQDWLSGKTTQDSHPLKLQDASRLLTERRGPSPAVTMPRSNFYVNGTKIALTTGPPALSNANTPAATPTFDQAPTSLFSAFRTATQRNLPSTALGSRVSAFARDGHSTSAMAPPATPHNADQFQTRFTPAFALSNNGEASGYTAPVTPPSSAFEFTASSTIAHASRAALLLQRHRRPAPRAHPYARLPGSPGGDCVQEEQPTEAPKKNKHIQRFKRREEFIDHRVFGEQATVGSSASAPDGGREDVSMELDETPAAQQGKADDDSDGSRALEDEGPVTPALGNDSTPAIHGFGDFHNDDDADLFADDDGMDIADDADRAKYSGVNRERTANDFYFPLSPASSSSSIQPAGPLLDAHNDDDAENELMVADEDFDRQLAKILAVLEEKKTVWVSAKPAPFNMAVIDLCEAITTVGLEYQEGQGGTGLNMVLVDNRGRELEFSNVPTETLSLFRHSRALQHCQYFSFDETLQHPHYRALATTTLPKVIELSVMVHGAMDAPVWDLDDLAVLAFPSLRQVTFSAENKTRLSAAKANLFMARNITYDGGVKIGRQKVTWV